MRCPRCGKFLKDVMAQVLNDEMIWRVTGRCAEHGVVEAKDWDHEDFFPDKEKQNDPRK